MTSYEISNGLNFEENPQQVFTVLNAIVHTVNNLEIPLSEDFNIPKVANEFEALKIVNALIPNPMTDHLFNAALAALNGEDPEPHMLKHATYEYRHGVAQRMLQARALLGAEAINKHADTITKQLREKVFTPTIKALTKLQAAHPGKRWDLQAAINAQDFKHAEVIKNNQHLTSDLSAASRLRGMLYSADAFTSDAAWISEPGDYPLGAQLGMSSKAAPHSFGWWMQLISIGLTPHFPTANEWEQADQDNGFAEQREDIEAEKAANNPDVQSVKAVR
ncbi:hypothetical protein ACTXI4_16530 [Glutamicibacter ardleyensis]|uniref:hypothetical protein n=1 Tax=Glutamicibacter ardleyensis TaxID=225894 RepID=UPI003FD528A3